MQEVRRRVRRGIVQRAAPGVATRVAITFGLVTMLSIRRILLVSLLLIACVHCDRSSTERRSRAASKPTETAHREAAMVEAVAAIQAHGLAPLSEYDGRIAHIVFHSADGLVGIAWRPVYDLLIAMPDETRFTFVCDGDAALTETRGRLRQWKLGARENIRAHLVRTPLLLWARDRYIAARPPNDGGLPIWIVPRVIQNFDSDRRTGEQAVPTLLNAILPTCRVATTPIAFEGGNVIASNQQVFVGANVLRDNTAANPANQTKAGLADLFSLPVTLIADETGLPPICHVDLFITPIADDHVLVGSPTLASRVMAKADDASTKALADRLFGKADFSIARATRFDAVAGKLASLGLTVTRVPYVDNRGGDFAVSYNNVLQEHRDGQNVVYMPIYKIPALDDAAAEAFKSLGMVVKPIDVSPVSHLLGATRCLANVVERTSGDD